MLNTHRFIILNHMFRVNTQILLGKQLWGLPLAYHTAFFKEIQIFSEKAVPKERLFYSFSLYTSLAS